jgi:hypothetical protein
MSQSFDLDELGLLHTMAGVAQMNAEESDAPIKIVNVLRSVMEKLESLIESIVNISILSTPFGVFPKTFSL